MQTTTGTASDTHIPTRAPAGPGSGAGPGAAAELQEQVLQQPGDRLEEREQDSTAAAAAQAGDLEAPRERDIADAVASFQNPDRPDRTSSRQVEPLARELPASVFHEVVDRTRQRIATGHVGNRVGLFVDLLGKAHADYRLACLRAAQPVQRTLADDIAADARSYATTHIPWDAAQPLIARKLHRLGITGDDEITMLEAAADTYHATQPSSASAA